MRLVLILLLFAGCHQLDRTLDVEIHRRNEEAKRSLEELEISRARDLYQTVLDRKPEQPIASAGWALADLLLLLDSMPVRAFLDRCNQPFFDVAAAIFGPDGLLSREDRADLGRTELETRYQTSAGAADTDIPWSMPTVRTGIAFESEGALSANYLTILVRDAASNRSLELHFNIDDVLADDGVVTPLVSGLEVSLDQVDGTVSIYETLEVGASRESEVAPSGRVRFATFGTEDGDPIAVELIDAQIPGFCLELPCTARYLVSGRIEDEISVVEIPREQVPFGTVTADPGPPFAQELIVAIERCDPLDDTFLAERVKELGDVLELEARRFGIAGESPGFTFSIPKRLLHIDQDLVLNQTDASALSAILYALSAAAELVSQYRWFEGDLHTLIEDLTISGNPVRDFEPASTAANLQQSLLKQRDAFSLARMRDRIELGLFALERSLVTEALSKGVLDFRHHTVRKLAGDWADFARTLRESLTSDAALSPAGAPLYRLHLRKLLEDPPTNLNAADRLGVEALARAGDDPYELVFAPELWEDWPALFGEAIVSPPDRPEQTCTSPEGCSDGYTCGSAGYCVADTPFLFSERALQGLSDGSDWPRFVNPLVREIIELGL